jgi:hypothetical protein
MQENLPEMEFTACKPVKIEINYFLRKEFLSAQAKMSEIAACHASCADPSG